MDNLFHSGQNGWRWWQGGKNGLQFTYDIALMLTIFAGLGVLGLYAYGNGTGSASLAGAAFIAGGAVAVGVLLGFLFGIPRTLQKDPPQPQQGGNRPQSTGYAVNTNLEQISDWLTKIIVGVGLVELKKIPPRLQQLAGYLAGTVDPRLPNAYVLCIMVFFSAFGFLLGYLWTRLYLTKQFAQAEQEARESPEYYEGLMLAFLYQTPPGGFTRAVDAGLKYLAQFGEGSERVWSYLACAYGQQYAFLLRAPKKDQDALNECRDKALEAVTKALQINPEAKIFLASLWDPSKVKSGEDDLIVFSKDVAFEKLLGGETQQQAPSSPSPDRPSSRPAG